MIAICSFESCRTVNESQKELLYYRLLRYFDGKISGRKFAVWGLSFKPETDDMREARL